MLYEPQSAGGYASPQPGGCGRGCGSHWGGGWQHRGLGVRALEVTEGAMVSKGFYAESQFIRTCSYFILSLNELTLREVDGEAGGVAGAARTGEGMSLEAGAGDPCVRTETACASQRP